VPAADRSGIGCRRAGLPCYPRRVQKLVLMSVLIATFWVPMAYASSPNIRRSVRKMRKTFAIFCVSYVIGIVYIMPRL
jgi:hypothetical protein